LISISIGKLRGLQQISSKRGTFTALALDHSTFLKTVAAERLSRLTPHCYALASPYTDFYASNAPFD
jgi:hypothetical protein